MQYCTFLNTKLCKVIDTEKDLLKVMKGFDFMTASENIVSAWEYITPQLIEKCFHHAGFIISVPTAPKPELEPADTKFTNAFQ